MGVRTIREWLVLSSLLLTGTGLVFFVFFSLAPALGFPLEYRQSLRVLEIIFPVFAGYLGSTTLFVFKVEQGVNEVSRKTGVAWLDFSYSGP